MSDSKGIALTSSRERPASTFSGYLMLLLLLVAIIWQVWGIVNLARGADGAIAHVVAVIAAPILLLFIACGFYMLQPNQAARLPCSDLSGHRPNDRPALGPAVDDPQESLGPRQQLHFRQDQGQRPARQPDRDGGADRLARDRHAPGLFDVDDYKQFVRVQVEAAIRTIGSRYPYDDFEHLEVTLRGNHDQVGGELRTELQDAARGRRHHRRRMRLHPPRLCAGDRRRDAPPPAGAGRGRGAQDLVEGAVGMVEMALEHAVEKNVVELDDERRAAMVSNLMVCCAASATHSPSSIPAPSTPRRGRWRRAQRPTPAGRSRPLGGGRALRRRRLAKRQRSG
jgi:hypothetical protein